jgi:hypothetical protein
MTYKNPESFDGVTVNPAEILSFGEAGPYKVVGMVYGGYEATETVIKDGFKNRQVAEVWLKLYLEMYVKDVHLNQSYDGWLFEPLDSDN